MRREQCSYYTPWPITYIFPLQMLLTLMNFWMTMIWVTSKGYFNSIFAQDIYSSVRTTLEYLFFEKVIFKDIFWAKTVEILVVTTADPKCESCEQCQILTYLGKIPEWTKRTVKQWTMMVTLKHKQVLYFHLLVLKIVNMVDLQIQKVLKWYGAASVLPGITMNVLVFLMMRQLGFGLACRVG